MSICVLPGIIYLQAYLVTEVLPLSAPVLLKAMSLSFSLGPLSIFVTMSQLTLVSNSYLDDLSNKTRSKPVPWEVRPRH